MEGEKVAHDHIGLETDGVRIGADEGARIGLMRGTADMLESPMERLNAAVVVSSPTAMLVAANFALEPVHKGSCQLLVYSCSFGKEKFD